jgi:serine phosphatase RsbU (regulator of sigma subunit)
LFPNDIIVMYTDGLIENPNQHEEFFSINQIMEIISLNSSDQLPDLTEKIINKLFQHSENQSFNDDISIYFGKFL